jgi:hypothetical protein
MAEGGGALRELLALFSLSVDSEELEKGAKKVEGFVGKLKAVGTAVAEAFAVTLVKDFFEEQIEGAAHIQDLAERLDVSATALKEFSIVAAGAGVGLDEAAKSLGFLSANLGKARLGSKESAEAFAKLGVKTKDAHGNAIPLMDVVGDVAEQLSRLPDQQKRAAYAMELFGKEGKALLPVLAQDKEKLKEMLEEAHELGGGLGDEYYEDAKKAREESEKLGFVWDTIKSKITLTLLPVITRMLINFKKLALEFVDFTKRTYFLRTALIFLTGLMGYKFATSVTTMLKALGLLKPSIMETIAALWKFALPILIIAALYLVFDDLFTLMKGGKSVIGDLLDKLFGLGAGAAYGLFLNAVIIDSIRFFKDLAILLVGGVLGAIVAVGEAVVALGQALFHLSQGQFDKIGKDFTGGFKNTKDIFDAVAEAGNDLVAGPSTALDKLQALNKAGIGTEELLKAVNGPQGAAILGPGPAVNPAIVGGGPGRHPTSFTRDAEAPATGLPAYALGPAGGPPVVNQTNTFNTTVHAPAGSDAKAIGQATGQGVATSQEKATNNAVQQLTVQ